MSTGVVVGGAGNAALCAAFEALGRPETFATAIGALDDGGRAVMVGIAPAGVHGTIDITRVVRRKLRIVGSYGARARSDMPALLAVAVQGLLRHADVITRSYSLDDAATAYRAMNRGEILGRAIIDMRL
jgi:succinate semialdehyde reductase (NADPH)